MLLGAVYGAWGLAAAQARSLGAPLAIACLALAACWFMSVQHELLHGHPTRYRSLNRWLGLAPLAVWYPYDLYRRSHLAHHRDEALTQPGLSTQKATTSTRLDYERLPRWCRPLVVRAAHRGRAACCSARQ